MPTTLPYSIFHIVQAYRTSRFAYQKKTTHCTSSSLRVSNLQLKQALLRLIKLKIIKLLVVLERHETEFLFTLALSKSTP